MSGILRFITSNPNNYDYTAVGTHTATDNGDGTYTVECSEVPDNFNTNSLFTYDIFDDTLTMIQMNGMSINTRDYHYIGGENYPNVNKARFVNMDLPLIPGDSSFGVDATEIELINVHEMGASFNDCSKIHRIYIYNDDFYVIPLSECFQGLGDVTLEVINTKLNMSQGCFAWGNFTTFDIPSYMIVGDGCFSNCENLTSVTIRENADVSGLSGELGTLANNPNLTSVTCMIPVPPILNESAFFDIAPDATLYVPAAVVEAYRNSDWATKFSTISPIAPGPVPPTPTKKSSFNLEGMLDTDYMRQI